MVLNETNNYEQKCKLKKIDVKNVMDLAHFY